MYVFSVADVQNGCSTYSAATLQFTAVPRELLHLLPWRPLRYDVVVVDADVPCERALTQENTTTIDQVELFCILLRTVLVTHRD